MPRKCVSVSTLDHYGQVVVPIVTEFGFIAFETEAIATKGLIEHLPYTKHAKLDDYDFEHPIIANRKLRADTYNSSIRGFLGTTGFRSHLCFIFQVSPCERRQLYLVL